MIARHVTDRSVLGDSSPAAPRRSCGPMMSHFEVGETHRSPAEHVGLNLVDRVGAGPDPESANLVPALAPKNLHASPDMEGRRPFQHAFSVFVVVKNSAANPD